MNVNLTKDSVLKMSVTLQSGVPGMKKSTALELISKMFGHPNWDTFSGLLKQENVVNQATEKEWASRYGWAKNPFVPEKPVTVYFDASSDDDSLGIQWASIQLDSSFVKKLVALHTDVLKADLSALEFEWPVSWGLNDNDFVSLHTADLIVGSTTFNFRALMRKYPNEVYTQAVDIAVLYEALANKQAKTEDYIWLDDNLIISGACPRELARALYDDEIIDVDEELIDNL